MTFFLKIKRFWIALIAFILFSCSNSVVEMDSVVRVDSDSCLENLSSPYLHTFSFLPKANKEHSILDIPCQIRGDSIVECFARSALDNVAMVASFKFCGDSLILSNGDWLKSGKMVHEYSERLQLTIFLGGEKKIYSVVLYPYTGLPYVLVETVDGLDVLDEVVEKKAHIRVVEDPVNPHNESVLEGGIVGHGNSTWNLLKKPYSLKFSQKTSLFSFPSEKSWLLLANHYDSTMLRNSVANFISRMSNIAYTPKNQFVELVLNGTHKGTYQLFEKIKVSKSRVNIGRNDFLLEVDNHPRDKDVTFSISNLPKPVKIHSPDVLFGDQNYNYIKQTIEHIDKVIFSEDYLDEENGYKKYIDIDALVEWYVVTEITKNASNRANWYMTYERNGKLKMGPFWDYDLAFGNTLWSQDANEISGFWLDTLPWFNRFVRDSIFAQKCAKRFEYFFYKKNDVLNEIDRNAHMLKRSILANNNLWNIFDCYECSEGDILNLYDEKVMEMKKWIDERFKWLNKQFSERLK